MLEMYINKGEWNRATSASPYVIAISKATSSLHKILMSHLPKADVQVSLSTLTPPPSPFTL